MAIWSGFVTLLESVLLTFFNWTGNAGVAIILFTIIARVLILPLTLKSLQSSRKMQELQPQIKELQRKYGKDPQKQQEEMTKLYREYKVNPVGGCLPMFIQLPIFLGVYQAVIGLTRVSVATDVAKPMLDVLSSNGLNVAGIATTIGQNRLTGGFLWLHNLGIPDPLYILPILSIVLQLIVQLMAMPRIQDPQQKAMTQSMLVLPLVFGYIGFTFPSGAVLYWVVGSMLSIIQQYIISGWGSLANYLKFLPTDAGFFPPPTPATAVASASGTGTVSEASTGETQKLSEPEKLTFWDVLRPLTEQNTPTEQSNATVDIDDTTTEQPAREVPRRPAGQRRA